MTASEPRLSRIAQIALTVDDLERAVAFYRDALGLELLFEAPPRLAFFDCDGVRLMLSEPEGEEAGASSGGGGSSFVLYFDVDDIDAAHERLGGRGVAFESPPATVHRDDEGELRLASFRDPAGNLLALMSRVPADA